MALCRDLRAYRWGRVVRPFVGGCLLWLFWPMATALAQEPEVDEPELPPVIVTPEPEEEVPLGEPTDIPPEEFPPTPQFPPAFPSLSQQRFEGLNSIFRGYESVFDTPYMATIVDRQLLDERSATDMRRALEQEVGILVQQTARGQASPFIRGLTGQQVLLLIDGIRVNNSVFRTGPNQYFNLVDPGQIERIEIVRGPQSVLWGSDALGGVINVVTRSPESERGYYAGGGFLEYYGSADSSSYSRANFEGWLGNSGVFGGGSYLNVRDLDRGGDLGRQPFTNYSQYAGDVKFQRLLGPDQMVTVALQHFEQMDVPRSDRFPPFVFGPPAATPRPTFFDPQQRDLGYVRWEGRSFGALYDAFSLTASYSRLKEGVREIRLPTRIDTGEFDVDTVGVSLVLGRDLDWFGTITYGGDWYYDHVSAFRDRINPIAGTVTPVNPQLPDDSTYQRAGGFVNWNVQVSERLQADAGVRYEHIEATAAPVIEGDEVFVQRHYQDWIGSVGLTYELARDFHLVGSVSEGFRAPNLDDLTADNTVLQDTRDIPSLGVGPEHSITYEAGFKIDTPRLRLQVIEWWTDLQDHIQREQVAPGQTIRANFDSYLNGTEVAGEYLLDGGWSAYGNFFYTYGLDRTRDQPLSRIPPAQGILGLRWRDQARRSYFELFTWLVRRQDRLSPQDVRDVRIPLGGNPGYGTLNLRMGTRLGRCDNHRISVALENITDKAYRVLGSGVDGPGFNAILGYEWIR